MNRLILILISGLCLTFGEPVSAQFTCAEVVQAPCPDTNADPDGLWPDCACPRPDFCPSEDPYSCGVDTGHFLITCTCNVPSVSDDPPRPPTGPGDDPGDFCSSMTCPDGSRAFSVGGDFFQCACRDMSATFHSSNRGFDSPCKRPSSASTLKRRPALLSASRICTR
jgi:hypothetical protein